MKGTRQRNVINVVSGHTGHLTGLAPTGHPTVDQSFITSEADIRTQAEPLCHARPETLDEHVGVFNQTQNGFDTFR